MPRWGFTEELLAQLIEEVSVLAAERRRDKPRQVWRPEHVRPKPKHNGFAALMAAAVERGAVHVV